MYKMSVPIIQGGMGVGISMGNLAGAVAAEGGMGVISTANIGFREKDFWTNTHEANCRALEKEISKAREIAEGKGMIAINAMVATKNFAEMVRLAVKSGIDAVVSGAGLPLNLPDLVGEKTLIAPIVSSKRAASLLIKTWKNKHGRIPSFIVVEGSKAGGHLGFKKEELLEGKEEELEDIISRVVSVSEGIPVFGAGGVFNSEDIGGIKDRGAVGAQIATRFIATKECDATQGYKDRILSAKEEDVKIIASPVGMPGRALNSPLIQKMERTSQIPPKRCIDCIVTCNPGTTPYCINAALISGFYGDWEKGLFFAGSNVGRINEMTTVKDLIKELDR
ncbi:MAG: nitronate monooxygenase family protein [Hornefia sp.]|nr:nitronate monooxygenase family protein [Hornefia sp.]